MQLIVSTLLLLLLMPMLLLSPLLVVLVLVALLPPLRNLPFGPAWPGSPCGPGLQQQNSRNHAMKLLEKLPFYTMHQGVQRFALYCCS